MGVLEMLKKLSKGVGDDEEDEEEEEGEAAEKDEKKSEEKTTFEKFYDEFKMFLLLGCHEDDANRSKLAKLLRFVSSYTEAQSAKKLTSLEDYVGRMQDEQPAIYYMSGEKVKEMEREASLEIFKKKGLEVLYLDEPYAELCFSKIFDFEGVKLRSVQKAGDLRINWDKEEGERYKNLVTMYKPLTKWWEKNIAKAGVPINKVEVSRSLVDSPAAVVGTEYGQSARQERMQSVQDQDPTFFSQNQKVLEINANHPVIHDLLQKVKADPEDGPLPRLRTLLRRRPPCSRTTIWKTPTSWSAACTSSFPCSTGLTRTPRSSRSLRRSPRRRRRSRTRTTPTTRRKRVMTTIPPERRPSFRQPLVELFF